MLAYLQYITRDRISTSGRPRKQMAYLKDDLLWVPQGSGKKISEKVESGSPTADYFPNVSTNDGWHEAFLLFSAGYMIAGLAALGINANRKVG